jgi:soluble lytic murein transglycosylase
MKRSVFWLIILLLFLAGAGSFWEWRDLREHRHDPAILQAAQRYGVDPALIKAVVWQESRFDAEVVGTAGEVGLMQVTEIAGMEWADSIGWTGFETNALFNPYTNTMAGTFYLARALKRYLALDDSLPYALAEYNAGRSRVLRWMRNGGDTNAAVFTAQMDIASTRAYIQAVTQRREQYRLQFPAPTSLPGPGGR